MKFYAWMVKHQDVISGFVSGIALMTAADYFAKGIASAPQDWHMLQRIWIDGDFQERSA